MIPGATTVLFPTCDHWLYIEDHAYFSSLVADFATNSKLTTATPESRNFIETYGHPMLS
jgi:hypothetical protein